MHMHTCRVIMHIHGSDHAQHVMSLPLGMVAMLRHAKTCAHPGQDEVFVSPALKAYLQEAKSARGPAPSFMLAPPTNSADTTALLGDCKQFTEHKDADGAFVCYALEKLFWLAPDILCSHAHAQLALTLKPSCTHSRIQKSYQACCAFTPYTSKPMPCTPHESS